MDWNAVKAREAAEVSGASIGRAVQAYIDAAMEERKARESYEGYEWGYYGDRYLARVAEAALDLDSAIRLVIRRELELAGVKPTANVGTHENHVGTHEK